MSIITSHFITVLLHNTLVSHYHHKKGFDMFHPYVFVEGAVQEVGLLFITCKNIKKHVNNLRI